MWHVKSPATYLSVQLVVSLVYLTRRLIQVVDILRIIFAVFVTANKETPRSIQASDHPDQPKFRFL